MEKKWKKKDVHLRIFESEWTEIRRICKDFNFDENFTLGLRLLLHKYKENKKVMKNE